jgi:hypothetical protein
VRFEIQASTYNTPAKKVAFILSYFKEGSAKLWKEQYYLERADKDFVEGNNFAAFIARLNHDFADTGRVQDALRELETLRQGRMTVDELNTRFRTLMQKAGLAEDHNSIILITYYRKALTPSMSKEIILRGNADTLTQIMDLATQLDSARRLAQHILPNAIAQCSQGHRKSFPQKFTTHKAEYRGEPMDIDYADFPPANPEEHRRRREEKTLL